jgi:NitT/TauT family transport system permease protein
VRVGFAMAWKIVVLVEALSMTDGVGQQLRTFFSYNEPQAVIAWTLAFTAVMFLVEILVFQTASRRMLAWRATS